jgi:molybdate transport system substrate-binding protein
VKLRNFCIVLLLAAGFSVRAAHAADDISVAAAADLQFVLPEVAAQFEKASGEHVRLTFGSSGNFFAQIQNGAPFDVFFSADVDYPRKLEAAGMAEPGSLYEYATGRLVLWAPAQSKLDLNGGLKVLLDPAVKRIAIANPEHAPYGRAAEAAMKHAGVYDAVAAKLVLGENISQTATFVSSGSADIGLLALSLAVAPAMKEKGRFVEVPPDDYPPIRQAAMVVKSAKNKAGAQGFMDFVKSPAVKELMQKYGFKVSEAAGK